MRHDIPGFVKVWLSMSVFAWRKEQADRECTIVDFKTDVCNVLVATSVAARGLDVKDVKLVINFDCPNHLEDYVHRVGRTGRAGQKGTAVTFISRGLRSVFAPDLVKAMKEAKQPVPQDVLALAEAFGNKRKEQRSYGKRFRFRWIWI